MAINRRWPKIGQRLHNSGPLNAGEAARPGLALEINGRFVSLVSPINPAQEGRRLAAQWLEPLKGRGLEQITVFGFLLGYHLESLLDELSPTARLLVFEARPGLLWAALNQRDLADLLNDPRLEICLGPFSAPNPLPLPLAPVFQPPAINRLLADDYRALRPPEEPAPPPPRIRKKTLKRVIVFDFGYYLNREVAEGFEDLGLEVARWRPESGGRAREGDFRALLELIKSFRPQLILTINHLGFDEAGLVAETLARLKLPAASWFVDSPYLILGAAAPQLGPWISVFSWDRDYLPRLKALGAENSHFLPLGASPAYFQPRPTETTLPWSFVGDSLERATNKYLNRLGLDRSALPAIDRLAREFLNLPNLSPEELIGENAPLNGNPPAPGHSAPAARTDLEALITWRAGAELRSRVLGALAEAEPGRLTIVGDDGWNLRLPGQNFQLRPEIDYYRDLSAFYQTGAVNLNVTSAQMKNGLNQRVFDVPASGAFLLTDYKEQLAEVFELNQEVVFYHHPQEALEKARWYARHPRHRLEVAGRARARVLKHHSYRLRLEKLLTLAAADHGLRWPS